MNVVSLFTGVGGFDLGLERAGHRIVLQCERDERCREVLARHWPDVPCIPDVRDVARGAADRVDLVCGGFPCQDLSVAGRRAGLAGERSGLFFEAARVADVLLGDGGWLLIENVPGLLSSNDGRDFAIVLATLADLGFYDLAWRVLDSRYFGVPQRRRRVFVLARRARGRSACEVLLEPEGGGGDFAAGREARARVASTLTAGARRPGKSAAGRRQEDDWDIVANALDRQAGGPDDNAAQGNHLVSTTLTARYGKGTDSDATDTIISHTLTADGYDASEDGTGRGTPLVADPLLSVGEPTGGDPGDTVCAAVDHRGGQAGPGLSGDQGRSDGEAFDPDRMRAPSRLPGWLDGGPVMCPVDPTPDGPRYRQIGNAVTVPVAEWIGNRLMEAQR